jgi:hypothetical protein
MKKAPGWKDSKGKKLLINDLCDGTIPMSGGNEETIYATRFEFGGDNPEQFRLFSSRLKSARDQVKKASRLATSSALSLQRDRQLCPKNEFNHQQKRRWQGSPAETLLKIDIQNGKQLEMKPKELYNTQEEYQKFPLNVFRGHIYQEEKLQKFLKHFNSRRT